MKIPMEASGNGWANFLKVYFTSPQSRASMFHALAHLSQQLHISEGSIYEFVLQVTPLFSSYSYNANESFDLNEKRQTFVRLMSTVLSPDAFQLCHMLLYKNWGIVYGKHGTKLELVPSAGPQALKERRLSSRTPQSLNTNDVEDLSLLIENLQSIFEAEQRSSSHSEKDPISKAANTKVLTEKKDLFTVDGSPPSAIDFQWIDSLGSETSPPNFIHHNYPSIEVKMDIMHYDELGMNICGGMQFGLPIFVSFLSPTGVAHSSNIKTGDVILSINGISCLHLTHAEMVDILQHLHSITMQLVRVNKVPVLPRHPLKIHTGNENNNLPLKRDTMSLELLHSSEPQLPHHSLPQQTNISKQQFNSRNPNEGSQISDTTSHKKEANEGHSKARNTFSSSISWNQPPEIENSSVFEKERIPLNDKTDADEDDSQLDDLEDWIQKWNLNDFSDETDPNDFFDSLCPSPTSENSKLSTEEDSLEEPGCFIAIRHDSSAANDLNFKGDEPEKSPINHQ